MISLLRKLLLILGAFLLATALPAADGGIAVGPEGSIIQWVSGTYGDLFPEGTAAASTAPVLALDVTGLDSRTRWLIPETEDASPEYPAALFYEHESNLTYVLWETMISGIHPVLRLSSFDGANWSSPVDITGNIFASKGHPQIVVARDSIRSFEQQRLKASYDRSFVCVAWWEETATGSRKYFAPLLFENGSYTGTPAIRSFSSFLASKQASTGVQPGIENLLRIQPGPDGDTVVVGFLNSETGRLVTMSLEVLPRELSQLAAEVTEFIETAGVGLEPAELSRQVGALILARGQALGFHPASLEYLAAEIQTLIESDGEPLTPENVVEIAPRRGIHIIHSGARMRSNGLASPTPAEIVEIAGPDGEASHHYKVNVLSDREPPAVGDEEAELYLSRSGYDALVLWKESDRILFRETDGAGWSDVQAIRLRDGLTAETVSRILAERILDR